MQHVLLIDNYDSFVHNLAHLVQALGAEVTILRNDEVAHINLANYTHLLLSPGPGLPEEAGDLLSLIRRAAGQLPILGVCLGHQAIAQCYGASLFQHSQPLHGTESRCLLLTEDNLWANLPNEITVGRYHSWSVCEPLPHALEVTARADDGTVMAFRHRSLNLRGVQFHPESILTPFGAEIIDNWLTIP